jgi:hypothetical protein
MTNRNKLIVGAVVVLGAFYLYDRNRKMKAVAQAKADAEELSRVQKADDKKLATTRPIGAVGLNTMTEII